MNMPVRRSDAVAALPTTPAIRLRQVRKAYRTYEKPFSFLKEVLTGRPCHRERPVLHDISLEIRRGEVVGIIGRNGAGKSTLLKIIAGTLAPTAGEVAVQGRVSAILELGTGFNPAYSGRDNVFMSALMRGMPEADIRRKFDSIVAFSGLGDVIDQPFHTYSSGMQARLAFAAAVSVEADVIIIDEAQAAGDIRFAARSLRRIREICASGVTALFVSHTTYQIMQLCTRAVWIDDGRIRMDGAPVEVVRAYEYEMHQQIARDRGRAIPDAADPEGPTGETRPTATSEADTPLAPDRPPAAVRAEAAADDLAPVEVRAKPRRFSTGAYRILDVAFLDRHRRPARAFRFGDRLAMRVGYECLLPDLPESPCGLAAAFNRTSDFEAVMCFNTNDLHGGELRHGSEAPLRRGVIEAVIDPIQLRAGEYYVSFGILPNRPEAHEFYEYVHCEHRLTVLPNGFDEPAVFYPMVAWSNGPLPEES